MPISTASIERWTKLLTGLINPDNYSKYKVIGGDFPTIKICDVEIKQMVTDDECVGLWLIKLTGAPPDEEFMDLDSIFFKDAPEIGYLFNRLVPLINAQANMNKRETWAAIFKELGMEDYASI